MFLVATFFFLSYFYLLLYFFFFFFFFNDTATTEIYTLSLHDALPIYHFANFRGGPLAFGGLVHHSFDFIHDRFQPGSSHGTRSEEHTSELQSQSNLVCRLLLEKKKNKNKH